MQQGNDPKQSNKSTIERVRKEKKSRSKGQTSEAELKLKHSFKEELDSATTM